MRTTLKKLFVPVYTKQWYTDLMLALPRMVACIFLAIDFGGSKFPVPAWFIEDVGKLGFPVPVVWAWAAVIAEVFGGLMLVLGLGTRVAGFLVTCTMLVAIFLQKWGNEIWEMLPAMGYLWIGIYAMVLGSGRFGLDHLIAKKL